MVKFTVMPLCLFLLLRILLCTEALAQNDDVSCGVPLVKRDQRTPIVKTEFGEISAADVGECGGGGTHHLHFLTLEPNALLLPVLLHSDMVFFVHTGSGILTWVDEDKETRTELRRGDVYRLHPGTIFYLQSNLEREIREKLRIYAIFYDTKDCLYDPSLGAYSSIRDLVFGFDDRILRSAFAVPGDVIRTLRNATKPPLIVHVSAKNKTQGSEDYLWNLQSRFLKIFVGDRDGDLVTNSSSGIKTNKKKTGTYNVFEADPDFENCNGRSIIVDEKDSRVLKGSSVGVLMVNLTKGSMMGPHWNPRGCEISIVLRGEGMVRMVRSGDGKWKSIRFMVGEGDVFVVPRFQPMAQMSFNNDSFVFMGFSTAGKRNYPQFLAGQGSVLQVLDREILETSFNVSNDTIGWVLGAQKEGVMLECTSCAEDELAKMEEDIQKRKEEEERKRREEEERRREEEERERKAKEEEEAEERRRKEEEARKREEEREREEEEAKRREEEKQRKAREEAERKKREEEEEAEARRREEEAEQRRREREEARKKEEEEAKRREEEMQRKAREEAERKRREEEEAEARRREEEAEQKRREEEEARKKEEEEAKRREEERQREEREQEERKKREEEETRQKEEERQRKEQEETERRRQEEIERKKREEERKREEEVARREAEERQRREREEEERKPKPPTMKEEEEEDRKRQP